MSWMTQSTMVEFGPGAGVTGGVGLSPVRSTPLRSGYESTRWGPLESVVSSWKSVGTPTALIFFTLPSASEYSSNVAFGSVVKPVADAVAMYATEPGRVGVTSTGGGTAFLYQTGVPLVSRIMA